MPSKRLLAAALAAMVLFAGCSALPGGGSSPRDTTEASGTHDLAFYSHTGGAPYNGTLTVSRDGDVVEDVQLSGDGTGTYVDVASFDESGEYTVTVNTSLPDPGGETMHESFTVDGALGNDTVVTMNYQDPSVTTYRAGDDASGALVLDKRIPEPVEYSFRVTHEGERVVDTTVAREDTAPFEVTDLEGAGVYRVEVQGIEGDWTNRTLVLTDAGAKLGVHGGSPPDVVVYGPDENVPNDP
ncbi:hypothetical protein [Halobacterium yunchengense]|uniref:hypothetical protein n=1 Tax=Halobacterium yunchengense TaxID=3108497 RepID=UPI003009E55A